MRGLFIVVEGLDRAGKNTLISQLVEILGQSGPVESIEFPDRSSPTGTLINQYLKREIDLDDWVIHELYAENRREKQAWIAETLAAEKTIVCGRYAYSGACYTAAKGYPLADCLVADKGNIAPDLVLYLDTPVDTICHRPGFGNERYEQVDFQARIREQFLALFAADKSTQFVRLQPETALTDALAIIGELASRPRAAPNSI
ncbi:Thymidylate kinase [Giardia muris]|uniref:dTMP kinase n=1 Tax=Giardia muris TaxID=5742 RepID=A0A4Z1SWS9_GIAMU|nr:Thymidylate kinase [Giardia muris]|eukprot:TNJ27978.1 Thymidylate kinase [Giardia muris]